MQWQQLGKAIDPPNTIGSALRDVYRPGESDIDLLIEFQPMDIRKRVHVYFAALDALKSVFHV